MGTGKVKILDDDNIEEKVNIERIGYLQMLCIHYKGEKYFVSEGDRYLRGVLKNLK